MDLETTRWQQVDSVFERALERPRNERRAFALEACDSDEELAAEVLRLLVFDDRTEDFLDRPVELEAPDWAGARVGRYRLFEVIGSGGMGVVYRAQRDDGEFSQEVAVKLLHSPLSSAEHQLRLRAERQILARLQHPNIARLYDGGCTDDGRPYLVMELIEGLAVDAYCDFHGLSIAGRLELFIQICGAVQHAHERLLVHRDLKASNILVSADGMPKLLDFGIAESLGRARAEIPTRRTRPGARAMTLRCASPEQICGEPLTPASDVYSLGVLLYELLTGRRPYRVEPPGRHSLEQAICEQDPPLPSVVARAPTVEGAQGAEELANRRACAGARELARRLAGDLDAIVLKTMHKAPVLRYRSAADLAEDLERYRRRQPVQARAGDLCYRAARFATRHRLAAAAVLWVVMATFATADHLRQAGKVVRERDKAEAVTAFLVDSIAQVDPSPSGEPVTARQFLEGGAERIERELGDQPLVRAALLQAIGEAYFSLGDLEQAQPLFEQATELRRQQLGARDPAVAESLSSLGAVLRDRSETPPDSENIR